MSLSERLSDLMNADNDQLGELNIELQKLRVETEMQRLREEKAASEIRIRRLESELQISDEMKLALFKEFRYELRAERRKKNVEVIFRMSVSLILIAAGLWLISRREQLGAYLLGTGATGAGLSCASAFMVKEGTSSSRDSYSKTSRNPP